MSNEQIQSKAFVPEQRTQSGAAVHKVVVAAQQPQQAKPANTQNQSTKK